MLEENSILTETTMEILGMLDVAREDIKNSMVIGENSILRGIDFFEKLLRELNPNTMDDEEISLIEKVVSVRIIRDEDICQRVNSYVHFGLDRCYLILWSYSRHVKGYSRKKVMDV